MTFLEWLYSSYPNPKVDGAWGTLHIITLLLVVAFIVISSILLKNKDKKIKYFILVGFASVIVFLGLVRRVVGFINATELTLNRFLTIMLPRPGCAIACWLVVIALIVNKKYFYNFASIISILCAVIFFAYPSVGFCNEYILFENLYSILTHSFFLIISVCFITYKFTDFDIKDVKKDAICLGVLLVYVFLEIYVLKIDPDPFYFMPNNDVIETLGGMSYGIYLPLYLVFVAVYLSSFYLITKFTKKKKS